jgi:NMD protein affecting ribosome stability and mRNA decay
MMGKRIVKTAAKQGRSIFSTNPRRLAGQQPDPYAVRGAPAGPAVCKECSAIYEKKRWHFDDAAYAKLIAQKRTKTVTCPACTKIHDCYSEGVLTLRWPGLSEHRRDVLGLLRKEEARAKEVNPLERIMKIEEEGNELRVFTTNTKLAQRMGREMERAYHGKIRYNWGHRDKLVRVYWEREEG